MSKNIKLLKLAAYLKNHEYFKEYRFLKESVLDPIPVFLTQNELFGPDPYKTLGVHREATEAEIRRKSRELLQKYHPDRFIGSNAEIKAAANKNYLSVNNAADIIRDQEKRLLYDQAVKSGKAIPDGQSAGRAAASGASSVVMTVDDLALQLNSYGRYMAKKRLTNFLDSNPKLTTADMTKLRTAIDTSTKLSDDVKGLLKGQIRTFNRTLWEAAKTEAANAARQAQSASKGGAAASASAAAESSAAPAANAGRNGVARVAPQGGSNPASGAAASGGTAATEVSGAAGAATGESGLAKAISQTAKPASGAAAATATEASGAAAAAGKAGISRVTINPSNLSRLATAGTLVKGIAGFMLLDFAGRALIDAAMSENVRSGWTYKVTLSSSYKDIAGYKVVGGIGSIVDKSGKQTQVSTIDKIVGAQPVKIGQSFSGKGAEQSESTTFVPAGVVIEMILAGNAGSVMSVFSAAADTNSAIVTATITDAMIKDAYSKTIGEDKVLQQALSGGSLGDIAQKQMAKIESDKNVAKSGFGLATTVGGAAYYGGTAAASGNAALAAGGLAGIGAGVGIAAAGYAGWQIGTAINESLLSRNVNLGSEVADFLQWMGSTKTQWKYTAALEQTDFIKKNVKSFEITVAKGKLYEKSSILNFGSGSKLSGEDYNEGVGNPVQVLPDKKSEVDGSGNYKNDGKFIPDFIGIRVRFNDGKIVPLFSPVLLNKDSKIAGCTVKEADIITRYNRRYPESAVSGQQPAAQKAYSSLESNIVNIKAYMLEVATKLKIANGFTPNDVANGTWDKKTDDLMINVVNNTFRKILSQKIIDNVSGTIGPGKTWKWANIAPKIGYTPNMLGVIKYFQTVNAKLG